MHATTVVLKLVCPEAPLLNFCELSRISFQKLFITVLAEGLGSGLGSDTQIENH